MGGSVGQAGVGSSTADFEIWLKGALYVECLCGSSVKGTWREGSFAGEPEEYMYKRFWRRTSLSIGAPFGEPRGGLIYWGI